MTRRQVVFAAVPSIIGIAALAVVYFGFGLGESSEQRGKELNERAWRAAFIERGLPVPEGGPREGYWGARTESHIQKDASGWTMPNVYLPGLVETDDQGMQHFVAADARRRLLIVGGSVAWGAYASKIDTTYFNVLGRKLIPLGTPASIDVLAAPAWKSTNEFNAVSRAATSGTDLVIVIDGLNDLIPLKPGDPHDGNFTPLLAKYLENIDLMAIVCASRGCKLLVVLQPSLSERTSRSPIEEKCRQESIEEAEAAPGQMTFEQALALSFVYLRQELGRRQSEGSLYFFDASRIFDRETATTFCDAWHFADPGHAILGDALATEVNRILER
jgi:hypothetical protein